MSPFATLTMKSATAFPPAPARVRGAKRLEAQSEERVIDGVWVVVFKSVFETQTTVTIELHARDGKRFQSFEIRHRVNGTISMANVWARLA